MEVLTEPELFELTGSVALVVMAAVDVCTPVELAVALTVMDMGVALATFSRLHVTWLPAVVQDAPDDETVPGVNPVGNT